MLHIYLEIGLLDISETEENNFLFLILKNIHACQKIPKNQ